MNEPEDLLQPLQLDARHFRLVLAVVEETSLTRASERLNVTQSALSHQLREIEERLRVQLFLRVKKRLVLTAAGEKIAASARRILAELHELEGEITGRGVDRRGIIRIATECYTCYDWLPPLLKRFQRQHPKVDVRIVATATSRPVSALLEGELDVAIVAGGFDERDVVVQKLFRDDVLLAVANDHPLAERVSIRPVDLIDENLILYSPISSSIFYRQFLAGSKEQPRQISQIQLTEAIVSMVRAGLGVSPLARWALAAELKRGRLSAVPFAGGVHREWSAISRRGEVMPDYLRDFIALIASDAQSTLEVRAGLESGEMRPIVRRSGRRSLPAARRSSTRSSTR